MTKTIKIAQFLDAEGRITQLPQKHSARNAVLAYLSTKFCMNVDYTEHQINDICDRWNTFGDFFLLRRELIDNGLLGRERDGSRYWRVEVSSSSDNDSVDSYQTAINCIADKD